MGTSKYNLPLVSGTASAKVPRDLNALATAVDDVVKNEVNVLQTLINSKVSSEYVDTRLLDKPTKTYVDSLVQSIASGSPKAVFNSFSQLQAAYPAGDVGIYVVSTDGKWYYWNGSAWTAGGTYQSAAVGDNTVLPKHTDFVDRSINLFNKDDADILLNVYIGVDGTQLNSSTYYTTHKIYVNPGDSVTVRRAESASGGCYRKDGSFISKIGTSAGVVSSPFTFTVPAETYYIRVSGLKANILTDMVVKGTTYPSQFTAYSIKLKFDENNARIQKLSNDINGVAGRIVQSENLFDKNDSTILNGVYINAVGTVVTAAGYFITGKIPCVAGDVFTLQYDASLSDTIMGDFYDVYGNRVDRINAVRDGDYRHITVPANATIVSMRLNHVLSKKDTAMVVKGMTYPAQYVSFKKTFDESFGLNERQKSEASLLVGNGSGIETNKLTGKIVLFNGDSITAGAGWTDAAVKLAPRNNTGWGLIVAQNNQMTGYGYGVGGGTIAGNTFMSDGTTPRHWISRDISNMQANADYIIFQGGINDYWVNVPLGTISTGYNATLDDTTFCGALESLFKQAQLKWKGKKIGFIITHKVFGTTNFATSNMSELYWEKARSICKKWSIPYIDLFNESGLNYDLVDIRNQYSQPRADNTGGDGCHPTEAAYRQYLATKIESWMKHL